MRNKVRVFTKNSSGELEEAIDRWFSKNDVVVISSNFFYRDSYSDWFAMFIYTDVSHETYKKGEIK